MILFLISRIHPIKITVKITSLDREQSNQSLAEVAGISLVYFKKLKNR